ncbi:hypothetical protein BDW42DRAFT_161992 [Aspergillus taichungensis]|uniref:DUF1749-domain-containing protein n=1 Tax=Aspergillus taichungensis TaxID=482145 RepID=A0A2J5I458_9EURO|nr:hypothetical protein BDW42DRAFT_161992 [Aspergillus taichungensis]
MLSFIFHPECTSTTYLFTDKEPIHPPTFPSHSIPGPMASKFWPKGGLPGLLHHYTETLVTFEYTTTPTPKPNSLVFIGGLGDGLATTSYTADLVRALAPTTWSLFTLTLTSSYQGWGLGHLDRDTNEIAQCVQYIQSYKRSQLPSSSSTGKVVLMGHSTGSQCVLHYLSRANPHAGPAPAFDPDLVHVMRPAVDGAILQAPVSDREAMQCVLEGGIGDRSAAECRRVYETMVSLAREAEKTRGVGAGDVVLPLELTGVIYPGLTAVSGRRFLSLVSPESPAAPREDDLFSSDIGDEGLGRTFGMVRERGLLGGGMMVLMSGADQSVPEWVDKEALLARWRRAIDGDGPPIWDERSGLIPNASHALSNDDQAMPRRILVEKVLGFLGV